MTGECICITAPMGAQGLEGYVKDGTYKFQKVSPDAGRPYYRVFPDPNFPTYYETCSSKTFGRYFSVSGGEEA